MIREHLVGTAELAFAEPIKEFGAYVFGFSQDHLFGPSRLRETIYKEFAADEAWGHTALRLAKYAPTWSARVLGTHTDSPAHLALLSKISSWFSGFRDESIGHGLSVRRVLQTLGTECARSVDEDIWVRYGLRRAQEMLTGDKIRCVVVTDCRFRNEIKAIREAGGEVWHLSRSIAIKGSTHASETDMFDPEIEQYVSRTIQNDGSLEDLRRLVEKAVDETFQ